nr:MATE family efflux transporter [Rufibacter sp. LB8]
MGSPAAAEVLFMRAGQIVYFGFIVSLGTDVFAAHQIAGNVEVISYMVGYGFATSYHLGRATDRRRKDRRATYAKLGSWMALGLMSVLGAFLFSLGIGPAVYSPKMPQ